MYYIYLFLMFLTDIWSLVTHLFSISESPVSGALGGAGRQNARMFPPAVPRNTVYSPRAAAPQVSCTVRCLLSPGLNSLKVERNFDQE